MRRITAYLIFSLVFLRLQANTKAQDILVPAGTRMSCAFVFAWSPRNTNEKIKYAVMRRMCYLPFAGRQARPEAARTPEEFALPGPTKVSTRESYSFPGRIAIRIIYITPTK